MAKERRTQTRFFLNLQARVSYGFTEDSATETVQTVAANISGGGAFLQMEHPLPLASKVQVEFLLSLEDVKKLKFILSLNSLKNFTGEQVWVKATGVVIRQQKQGVAIIFDTNYQLSPMQSAS